jgi:hypothetical protein
MDRVERFTGMPGRFEEPPGIFDGPGLALAALPGFAALGHLNCGNWITGDRVVFDRAGECGAEHIACVFAATRRERFPAAFPGCAAAPFVLRPRTVFAQCKAPAGHGELVQPLPDISHLYFVKVLTAKIRIDVQAAEHLVVGQFEPVEQGGDLNQ